MILALRVALRDFRSYERAELDLDPRITVLHGPNGAGKTNLLEALHFGLTARSCRGASDREVVRQGTSVARVEVSTAAEDGMHLVEVAVQPGVARRVRVDGAFPERTVDPPAPSVAVFDPDRLELVKGAPAERRAHLDRFVGAVWPARSGSRTAYARALGQRNALLGRVRTGAAPERQLDPWDEQLALCGAALMADRAHAIDALAPRFAVHAEELGSPAGTQLAYRPRSPAGDAEGLERELHDRRRTDVERGFTTHGPHRDDLTLTAGGRALRSYGSQGQQRLAVLALLFAERDLLAESGRPPLMLLDDVMSELDAERRRRLVDLLSGAGQALITTTDPAQVPALGGAEVAVAQLRTGVAPGRPGVVAA